MSSRVPDERAVNTVVDVSLALLFVGIAVSALAALPGQRTDGYDPHRADYTADMLGSSTINVTYSLAESGSVSPGDESPRADRLRRVSHGSVASQIGDAAVAKARFDGGERLTNTGTTFERALDERVQAALVESSFETNVTATWEPFEGAQVSGKATVGPSPPEADAVSASTMQVPSGMASVRGEAIEAVEGSGGYEAVATLLAEAVIEGYLPELESKRALENSGPERTLTRRRYERVATAIDGATPGELSQHTRRHAVDTGATNEYLADKLADQFEAELRADFESPATAATAVSVGEVTIAVRTWQP